ncbi:tetratricopeptide repeat-containing protein [Pseudomonas veronii]
MKLCFVVMGYGKKTEYETGRTLDLNATYETIIEPAVTKCGLRCVRADEIMQSGLIDVKMYDLLLRADLVIADISTGNVNAVYELGVRHALRPNSTIVMSEDKGKLYFDLNHISIFQYSHFGEDILGREARRATEALGNLIESVMAAQEVDSPVYTFLPRLRSPRMSEEEIEELVDEAEAAQQRLFHHMREGERWRRLSNHHAASVEFAAAREMKPGEPDILQKLALSIYKAKLPDDLSALRAGLEVLQPLTPESSNDPETVGIAGAISKRIWLLEGDRSALDAAIAFYRRGFEVKRDYYNGENLALCFEFRGQVQTDDAERTFDFMCAQKIREAILKILHPVLASPDFTERSDKRWIYATLANCYFAMGNAEQAQIYENLCMAVFDVQWEIETYQASKDHVLAIRQQRLATLSSDQR